MIDTAARSAQEKRARRVANRVLRMLPPIAHARPERDAWDLVVRLDDIPPYELPGPRLVLATLSRTGTCCRPRCSSR